MKAPSQVDTPRLRDSHYDSLQLSLTRRLTYGLEFLASHTFAKSMDNGSGQGGGAGISGVTNPGAAGDTGAILGNQLDDRANRGVSDSTGRIASS